MSFLGTTPREKPFSPAPSATSDGGLTPTAKRKRDVAPEVPFSQPQLTGYGDNVNTNMTFAVEYLKGKTDVKDINDIMGHLSIHRKPDLYKKQLVDGLRAHTRVEWRPDPKLSEQTWMSGTYKHRPLIPGVNNGPSLLSYLQRKKDAHGVSVKDLEDGWPEVKEGLVELEKKHLVLVFRTKKDNIPRTVWSDDPSLYKEVDAEFKQLWHRVQLPSIDDTPRRLVAVGQKPTSEDPLKIQQVNKPKVQKKRATKKINRATNTHMAHLLQDYTNNKK